MHDLPHKGTGQRHPDEVLVLFSQVLELEDKRYQYSKPGACTKHLEGKCVICSSTRGVRYDDIRL